MSRFVDRPSPSDAPPRREPLPWEEPKPALDDPQAPERVRERLASPTYRQADKDLDFLDGEDTRATHQATAFGLNRASISSWTRGRPVRTSSETAKRSARKPK